MSGDVGRVGDADQALVNEAPAGLHPTGFDPSRGPPWHWGVSDRSYGTRVWYSRVENLRCHLKIIATYLPEDSDWLQRQVQSAMNEADRYLTDWSPLCDSDGSSEAGETQSGSTVGDSAGRETASPNADRTPA